jgi:hypothetical protein
MDRFQVVTTMNDSYLLDSARENKTVAVFVSPGHRNDAENVAAAAERRERRARDLAVRLLHLLDAMLDGQGEESVSMAAERLAEELSWTAMFPRREQHD